MQRLQLTVLAMVGLLLLVPSAAVGTLSTQEITGQPGLDISVPENEVSPGEQTRLRVVLLNDGNVTSGSVSNPQLEQQVTTARSVRVRIGSDHDAPVSVTTNEQAIAALPDGNSAPVEFGLTVDRDAEPGSYRLPVNVSYNYTQSVDTETSEYNRTSTNRTFNATLEVVETAQFQVTNVESNARVGATGDVHVTLRNTGSEVARNASVELASRNGALTFGQAASSSRFVDGGWAPGETRTVSYRVRATQSASQQRYTFDSTVTYEDPEGTTAQSRTLSLGVTPAPEQRFTVLSTNNSLAVAEEGTVNVTLRNDGPIPVRDASVTLQTGTEAIVFGGSPSASQYVGHWGVNETRTIQVDAAATENAEERNYSVQTTVAYDDAEGDPGESRPLQFGLRPAPDTEYEFAASDVSSTLRVGEEGTLTGTITNTGDAEATSVVVVYETENQNLSPLEREYSVGTLAPGESATFEFDVDVSEATEAGPRQFTFRTRYRDQDGDQRESDTFDLREQIRPERNVFAVEASNATVERGGSTVFEVTVTNAGNETFSDVSAQLFADDPIDVDDSDAFRDSLDPGESKTFTFEISAGSGALAKQYPVEMDFQYDDADGDTLLSDGYRLPVEVTEPEQDDGGGLQVGLLVVGLLVVLAGVGGYFRYGR